MSIESGAGESASRLSSRHTVTGAPGVVRVPAGSTSGSAAVGASTGTAPVGSPARTPAITPGAPGVKVGAAQAPLLVETARIRTSAAVAGLPSTSTPRPTSTSASAFEPTVVRRVSGW